LVGTAVKRTLVPEQIGPVGFEDITILTGNNGLTVITITFEVSGLPEGQFVFDVKIQRIASLLTKLAFE